MSWIIRNAYDPELCWSDTEGWTEDNYDTFDDTERERLSLPMDGVWEQVHWKKES